MQLPYHGIGNYGADLGVSTLKILAVPEIPLSDYLFLYGLPLGATGESNAAAETINAAGAIVTPDFTLSYNPTTDQVTIDQIRSVVGALGTLASGGVTTLDLSSATGLPSEFNYDLPDRSDITAQLNGVTGAVTRVYANETGGMSYQISYDTASGLAMQTNF